ncbi:MAG: hypothetical protein Q9213_001886 [Squamulea squamosa]
MTYDKVVAGDNPIPIAVVGISCRFPAGATDPEKFWKMLSGGESAWSDVPQDRFAWETFHHPSPDMDGTTNHRGGHFLKQNIAAFDAGFFAIHPTEASSMDPQQRVQLETAFEALENAGLTLEDIRGSDTAVYVAVFGRDYDQMLCKDPLEFGKYHMTGTGNSIVSNRISYMFDLKGPSMTLDTGCSGGLVALHQACQSLRSNESNMALVGGTNLILSPESTVSMSLLHVLNPSGKCYPFDSRGEGYGRGEGVATLVLKRLDDALAAGDCIRGVIRHTGVNQDGKTAGLTLPNQAAQEALVRKLYSELHINPLDVHFIEAHGTGTVAGDQAEYKSISKMFCRGRTAQDPLFVGAVKSSIGHLESVSGLAGVIKAILVLEKRLIPPNTGFEQLKSNLSDGDEHIKIPVTMQALPQSRDGSHYASVNSFGYGGTNAHAVLQAASTTLQKANGIAKRTFTFSEKALNMVSQSPETITNGRSVVATGDPEWTLPADSRYNRDDNCVFSTDDQSATVVPGLIILTAKSKVSLLQRIKDLTSWVCEKLQDDIGLRDLAYTLSCRRSAMLWRYTLVVDTPRELLSALASPDPKLTRAASTNPLTYIFTGQGAQWYAMGRELIFACSEFRESLLESDRMLRGFGSTWSLMDELLRDEKSSRISEGQIAQPASTAIQIALVDLFSNLGLHPTTVVGHSSGEIAAAYTVGALTKLMALRASYCRGSIFHDPGPRGKGAMLAVGLSELETSTYISQLRLGRVCIASVNSPTSVTVSGDAAAIDELETILKKQEVFARKLQVGLAYHSHHMEDGSVKYLHSLQGFESRRPRPSFRYISAVTGSEKFDGFGGSYWVTNLISKVRFADAISAVRHSWPTDQMQTCIEIGPHSTLSGPVHQTLARHSVEYTYLPSLTRKCNSLRSILALCGQLFELGHKISMGSVTSLMDSDSKRSVICDLPSYPWDHSQTFWNESRLSREHRLRVRPPHDLLGSRITGCNPLEPMWRNVLKVENLPWLRDHVVDGSMIFPGSGYLCSAIEALRQEILDRQPASDIQQFVLRDVVFSEALIIPESPGKVEIQVGLRPFRIGHQQHTTGWNGFRIFSRTPDGVWNENCRGSVMAELNVPTTQNGDCTADDTTDTAKNDVLNAMESGTMQDLSTDQLYESLDRNGNSYGPTFATLKDVKIGDRQALGYAVIPDITACMPAGFMQSHVMHPTTLDSFFHVSLPLFVQRCLSGSVLPRSIEEVIVPADITKSPSQQFLVTGSLTAEGPRSAKIHISAFPIVHGSILRHPVTISNGEIYNLGQVQTVESNALWDRSMTYRSEWDLDVDFARQEELISHSKAPQVVACPETGLSHETRAELLDRAASLYIGRALSTMLEHKWGSSQKHNAHLLAWMHDYHSSESYKQFVGGMDKTSITTTLRIAKQAGVEGELLTRVGPHIAPIIAGLTEPLNLLLEGGLLQRFYAEGASSVQASSHLIQYLERLVFKHPHMKILEIGAGTGATTLPVLQALTRDKQPLFAQYNFTDISAEFFPSARNLLQDWSANIDFQTLDVEQDPTGQGFPGESYDLVIAANVLHATHKIDTTLANVRKLLKPGGRLAMLEITRPRPFCHAIFGLLPGWWNGFDEGRRDGPLLSLARWDEALSRGAFTGVEVAVKDFEDSSHTMTLMISRLKTERMTTTSITPDTRPTCRGLSMDIAEKLDSFPGAAEVQVVMASCLTDHESEQATYIVLDEGHAPFLMNPSEEGFARLASLMTRARRILWVTIQAGNDPPSNVGRSLITGLSRSARSENQTLQFVILHCFQQGSDSNNRIVRAIDRISAASFGPILHENQLPEPEYILQNGQLSILRLIPDTTINRMLVGTDQVSRANLTCFNNPNRCLKLCVEKPGLLDSLVFHRFWPEGLDEGMIEIQVKAFGINFRDVSVALGQMKDSTSMAGECAGLVTAVGANCHRRFQVGDRVCAWFATPSYANSTRVRWSNASRIPDTMSFTTAASIPMVFLTAYYGLVDVAKIQRDQTVLIHSAAGGVGQAAVMIATAFGAKVFATAGSPAKRSLLVKKYGIPDSNIFSSRSRGFGKRLLQATQGRGVDIVLNSLSGEALLESWNCIAELGTFVELGKIDIYSNSSLSMRPFDKGVTFASLDLTAIGRLRPNVMKDTMDRVMSLFETGILTTVYPITTFPITDIDEAFRLIQARKHMGKVVVEVREGTLVKAVPQECDPLSLDPEGTYVIAGGLGGLGREIARMMSAHGARNMLLLTRRNLSGPERSKLEVQFGSFGTHVRIETCDVADTTAVQSVANRCRQTMPPVRGVIQAAMILQVRNMLLFFLPLSRTQDRILEQMTARNFKTAIRPKVDGTLNLSEAFEGPSLDFFIMLSSVSNILGSISQANYAAGNAFQDEFARSRRESRTYYLSLSLGLVSDSEIIRRNPELHKNMVQGGAIPLELQQILRLLQYAMGNHARQTRVSHIAVGFDRKSIIESKRPGMIDSPVFSHLPYDRDKDNAAPAVQGMMQIEQALTVASNDNEKFAAITSALKKQVSSLLATSIDNIDLDSPMESLGLDSLMAVELKTWFAQILQAAIQTSEILDTPNLRSLASTVRKKSRLFGATQEVQKPADGGGSADGSETKKTPTINRETPECITPPRPPLVGLESTLQFYLSSIRAFCSEEQFQKTTSAVDKFRKPGGIGSTLQGRLVERADDPRVDSWLYDLYNAHVYLKQRAPINPWGAFFGAHAPGRFAQSQAERTAIISATTFQFKQLLDAGEVESETLNGQALCMDSLQWLFNSIREPGASIDTMQKFASHDYLIAMRRGHFFKVLLTNNRGASNSIADLAETFQAILDRPLENSPSIASLTAGHRASWAQIRQLVQSYRPTNETLLRLIEAAAFIVCLDEDSPSTPTERSNYFSWGSVSNRWADKPLQFAICSNGTSAYICEHALIDAGTLRKLSEQIQRAIETYEPRSDRTPRLDLEEYTFESNPEIDKYIQDAEAAFQASIIKTEWLNFTCGEFGTTLLKQHGYGSKGAYQIVIQLASLMYFGTLYPSWETVTMRSFHKGRVDIIQSVLPPVAAFCTAMRDPNTTIPKRRELLNDAIKIYTSAVTRISRGRGFAHHLYALQEMVAPGEEIPEMFRDEMYAKTRPGKIMTDCVPFARAITEGGFVMPDVEHVWVHYEVEEEW